MTTDDKIKDEKLQYDITREGKIDILLFDQSQMTERANITYSPRGKAFGKQTKTIKDQGRKQENALQSLSPKQQLTEAKDERDKVKNIEQVIIRYDFIYETGNKKG